MEYICILYNLLKKKVPLRSQFGIVAQRSFRSLGSVPHLPSSACIFRRQRRNPALTLNLRKLLLDITDLFSISCVPMKQYELCIRQCVQQRFAAFQNIMAGCIKISCIPGIGNIPGAA